ncbi:hypothetical protein TWF106_004326 [Orbilia oligospora]|uniref:Uncharacterized protein n=1 Tax=Orbilia oligospora TaxID=2813651 RepID=A0A6G1MN69_ORBOL|nr:hypothetical protein TWF788_003289 [Orbilia oligospora]KAF3216251.1 hypothetical protein TWF191_009080 [Orbilia oligospora]KAF3216833.1 hypothetical protein TWF679_002674 [Orbilia oligospora]KAF3229409.1 hypothetical protein TWF106_004326 [Orbilia oligospora]KAF3264441.1 hypothetical protein TWF192_004123 [Orbilia oligospora]
MGHHNLAVPEWKPFISIPRDTAPRIRYLQRLLKGPQENATHIENIKAVLKALKNGETPHRYYQNGQPVDIREADLDIPVWFEDGQMPASSSR